MHEPVLITLEYHGKPNSKDLTALVGKGMTYDTGGLNLKSSGMECMKCDMGGAAAVLSAFWTAVQLELPINLVAVVPSAENSISAKSYKPGDVYVSYSGKTVEITNTDAEGRLILADALAYTIQHFKPSRILEFATLTGGIEIALGSEASGMMSNNDAWADMVAQAGKETFERVWQLPMYDEYKDILKSDIADIKNYGGRSATSIVAAQFMRSFIDDTPWVHLDIASTAFSNDAKRYHPKYGTGIGVRLTLEVLEMLCKKKHR
jgi:leucyl aminopeptidase